MARLVADTRARAATPRIPPPRTREVGSMSGRIIVPAHCGTLAAILVLALAYLFGAFVAADWNVVHWEVFGRLSLGLFGLTFAFAAAVAAAAFVDDRFR